MKIAKYDTDLTDEQWACLKPMLPKSVKRGRSPKDTGDGLWMPSSIWSNAAVLGAICPPNFPTGKPFTTSSANGSLIIDGPSFTIRFASWFAERTASAAGQRPAILDSQSVKSAGHGGCVGYDAGKRIEGRKRHLLVDTLGLILGVTVTPASTTERDGAQMLLKAVLGWFTWLRILWVDGGYTGEAFA